MLLRPDTAHPEQGGDENKPRLFDALHVVVSLVSADADYWRAGAVGAGFVVTAGAGEDGAGAVAAAGAGAASSDSVLWNLNV